MDNFEGGISMQTTQSVTTGQPMSHDVMESRSGETFLQPEYESQVTQTQVVEHEVNTDTHKNLADRLLNDSKTIGFSKTFERLALGEYREDTQISAIDTKEPSGSQPENIVDDRENSTVESSDAQIGQEVDEEKETYELQKDEVIKYLADELEADPLMKDKIGEVAQEMIGKEETIDASALREEAVKRYASETELGASMPLEQQLSMMEEKLSRLLDGNVELKQQLGELKFLVKNQSEMIKKLAVIVVELAKKLHEENEDEVEKASLLELLIVLVGVLVQETVSSPENEEKNNTEA
jgi:hypothetical protein